MATFNTECIDEVVPFFQWFWKVWILVVWMLISFGIESVRHDSVIEDRGMQFQNAKGLLAIIRGLEKKKINESCSLLWCSAHQKNELYKHDPHYDAMPCCGKKRLICYLTLLFILHHNRLPREQMQIELKLESVKTSTLNKLFLDLD